MYVQMVLLLRGSGEARAVALDTLKAFDRIWYSGLLHKLDGVTARIFGLIQLIQTNRLMKAVLDGHASRSFQTNAVAPQGSVLGSTLFLIFINDLPAIITY